MRHDVLPATLSLGLRLARPSFGQGARIYFYRAMLSRLDAAIQRFRRFIIDGRASLARCHRPKWCANDVSASRPLASEQYRAERLPLTLQRGASLAARPQAVLAGRRR